MSRIPTSTSPSAGARSRRGISAVRGPAAAAGVLLDVARIATSPWPVQERAEALLEPLGRLLPFDGAWLALTHPDRRGHLSLLGTGYDEKTRAYLDGPVPVEDIERLGLARPHPPMRAADSPVPVAELPAWADCLHPAGFREGVGTGLFTRNGRYLGFLALFTESAAPPDEDARDALGVLSPLIAAAVDPMQSVVAATLLVRGAMAGVVMGPSGPTPLPGMPDHPMLASGARVLGAAVERLQCGGMVSFLAPDDACRDAGRHVRVTVLGVHPDPPCQVSAVVVLSPPGQLRGLTPRELDVLGLLVDGCSNRAIAAEFVVTERTVATHVEHILVKLEASSRAFAAVRAQREGLYVPRSLAVRRG